MPKQEQKTDPLAELRATMVKQSKRGRTLGETTENNTKNHALFTERRKSFAIGETNTSGKVFTVSLSEFLGGKTIAGLRGSVNKWASNNGLSVKVTPLADESGVWVDIR